MPTYLIEGKQVKTDAPLSEDEIDEIASSIKTKATPSKPRSLVDELFQGMKTGITNLPTGLSIGSAAATGSFAGSMPVDTELEGLTKPGVIREQVFGVQDKPAQSTAGRYLQAIGESITDPLSLAAPGGFVSKGVQAAGSAVGATLGGDIGSEAERALRGGKESGTGRVLGSLLGGVGSQVATTPTREAVRAGTDVAGQVWNKVKGVHADPEAAEHAMAAGSAKRLLQQAATAQGAENLDNILTDVSQASRFVTKADAPLLIAAADNPVLKAQLVRLIKTNPEARQRVDAELAKLKTALEKKKDSIFGQRYTETPNASLVSADNAVRKVRAIDNQLEKLTTPLTRVSKTDTGAAVENLVNAKRSAVKAELAPQYAALTEDARARGVKMPAQATEDLFTFVEANGLRDIFGKATATDRKVMKILQPTEKIADDIDPNILALERGAGIKAQGSQQFNQMSFDDVDSLKKAVNEQLRVVKDDNQRRKLFNLKDRLNEVRDQYLDPDLNGALKALDTEYYTKLGIPFGQQGVKDIDSAKYAASVAPVILKNREAYSDFVSVGGDQAKQIAANAMLSKAHDTILKDGIINPRAVSTFMKQNAEVLDMMPEVKKTIQEATMDTQKLIATRTRLDAQAKEAQKRIADNWLSGTNERDFKNITDQVLNNPKARAKLQRDLSDLDPETSAAVRGNLRAELANKVLNNPQGAVSYLTDPRNKEGLRVIMGSGYQDALMKVGKLSDALSKVNTDKFMIELSKGQTDALGKLSPGLDVPFVTSTLRDRISSPIQKAVRILSRVNVARAQEQFDAMTLDLLLDPQGMQKLANVAEELDFKIKTPENLNKVVGTFFSSIPPAAYTSLQVSDKEQEKR